MRKRYIVNLTVEERAARPRKLDGASEARLVQIACSEPPAGRARRTMSLVADRLVELKVFDSVSPSTVQRGLKKNETKPWLVERFCIPPEQNAAFVKCMEHVLEVYHRPYDRDRPQVCLDETSTQLLEHTASPSLRAQAHRPGSMMNTSGAARKRPLPCLEIVQTPAPDRPGNSGFQKSRFGP
jgi:hypothetical protein